MRDGWKNLKVPFRKSADPERALKAAQRKNAVQQRVFGGSDVPLAHTKADVANELEALGRFIEARLLREEVWSVYQANLGGSHPATLSAELRLAQNLSSSGLFAEAKLHAVNVYESRSRIFGSDDRETQIAEHAVAAIDSASASS